MRRTVQIENIEALRREAGIDDRELRKAIRSLRVGDLVRLTLLGGATSSTGETLPVQVTTIRGTTFEGRVTRKPVSGGLASVRIGSPVTFTRDHIHSIPPRRVTHD